MRNRTNSMTLHLLAILVVASIGTDRVRGQGPFFNPGAAGAAASTAATQVNSAATVVTASASIPGATPPPNLWDFLGVPQMLRGSARIASRVRYRVNSILPFGKKRPPIDAPPPGMASPAANSAGQMQKAEANAEANVQAIKYLGNFGCSDCFPEIEEALFHALSDCMAGPRTAALQVINAHAGSCCTHCSGNSCCSLRIREALHDIAHGVDELGCAKVTDPHQRRLAREALRKCCCVPLKVAKPNPTVLEAVPETLPIPTNDAPMEAPAATGGAGATNPVSFEQAEVGSIESLDAEYDLLLAEVGDRQIRLANLVTLDERRTQLPDAALIWERLEGMIDFHAVTLDAEQAKFVAPAASGGRVPRPGDAWYARAYVESLAMVNTTVTDKEAYSYFEANRQKFNRPPLVVWEQLSVPIRYFPNEQHALRVAEYLRQQAMGVPASSPVPAHEDYDYVVEISEPTPIDQVPPHTWKRLESMQDNEVGEIERMGDRFVMYSLHRRVPERPGTFVEMQGDVREDIVAERRLKAMNEAVQQARRHAVVWIAPNLDDVLSKLVSRDHESQATATMNR